MKKFVYLLVFISCFLFFGKSAYAYYDDPFYGMDFDIPYEYHTIAFTNEGVDNVEIPSDMAVITRGNYYNTSSLLDYNVDPAGLREKMNGTNTYACALSYTDDFEIDIDIDLYEQEYILNIGDLKEFSNEELKKVFSSCVPAFDLIENLELAYVNMNGNSAIKASGYLQDLDQYVVCFYCTSTYGSKNYGISFKLYSFGKKPTSDMTSILGHMVYYAKINQPKASDVNLTPSEAKKRVATNSLKTLSLDALSGLIIGGVLAVFALIFALIKKIISRKKNTGDSKDSLSALNEKMTAPRQEPLNSSIPDNEKVKCICCGKEISKYSAECPECGQFLLKYRFFLEHECDYSSEEELIKDIDEKKASIGFLRRTLKLQLAKNKHPGIVLWQYFFIAICAAIEIFLCVKTNNYWGLIIIPLFWYLTISRYKTEGLVFIIMIASFFWIHFPAPVEIGLLMCFIARIFYYLFMAALHKSASSWLFEDTRRFYLYWYNGQISVNKGDKVQFHSENKS